MARFSLHTVGNDQPGIVASLTVALAELGANLEETNMTILHGQSSVMLVLEIPEVNDGRLVEGALEEVAEKFDLFVTVCPLPEDITPAFNGESFLVSIEGHNRPGIVAGVTTALADVGANVIDLISRPIEQSGTSAYVLRLTVALPAGASPAVLEASIANVADRLELSHSVRPWSSTLAWDTLQ